MESAVYLDLNNGERETLFFFFLNAFLLSRLDMECESAGDEEVNVYIAHLLHALVDGRFYVDNADTLATTPVEVFAKIEEDASYGQKLRVYRSNADHRLVAFGLFSGWGGHQSLYRSQCTEPEAYLEEAQQYYGWAACCGARLSQRYRGLAGTLETIAEDFELYRDILAHMGTKYLNFCYRLSPGEFFHLERQANEAAQENIRDTALNRMLDAYNRWKLKPTSDNRRQLREHCAVYVKLAPDATEGLPVALPQKSA